MAISWLSLGAVGERDFRFPRLAVGAAPREKMPLAGTRLIGHAAKLKGSENYVLDSQSQAPSCKELPPQSGGAPMARSFRLGIRVPTSRFRAWTDRRPPGDQGRHHGWSSCLDSSSITWRITFPNPNPSSRTQRFVKSRGPWEEDITPEQTFLS